MNKIGSFIFGLVLGAVSGTIVTKIICDKNSKKDLDEAKRSFRDYIRKNTVVEVKEAEPVKEVKPIASISEVEHMHNLVKDYVSNDSTVNASNKKKEESPQDDPASSPIRISRQKFKGADESTVEKAYLVYYEDGDILADDDEDLYNPEVIMGKQLHDFLVNNAPNATEAIYIHDEKLKIMYEISIIHDSYESVTGEELTGKAIKKSIKE